MYTLFLDTDCDITPKIVSKYGAKLISMPYAPNGKEIFPYVDFKEFDYKEFYKMLRDGVIPSTSALPPTKYIEYFEPEFKAGRDILYVHFSSAMSGTFNSMRLALEELYEKYPDRKVYTIDTKAITLGAYNICLEICDLYKAGKSIEEIQKWAEKEIDKFAVYFYADNLKFFAKSGRVSGLAAFMGGIIGLRPIIFMDGNGVMKTCDKSRGKMPTLNKLLQHVIELQDDIKSHRIVIAHCDALDIAHEFADMLRKEFGDDLDIDFSVVNPTAGSHCGPDCIGVSFHSIHR